MIWGHPLKGLHWGLWLQIVTATQESRKGPGHRQELYNSAQVWGPHWSDPGHVRSCLPRPLWSTPFPWPQEKRQRKNSVPGRVLWVRPGGDTHLVFLIPLAVVQAMLGMAYLAMLHGKGNAMKLAVHLGRRQKGRFWWLLDISPRMVQSLTLGNLSHNHGNILIATSLWQQCREDKRLLRNFFFNF